MGAVSFHDCDHGNGRDLRGWLVLSTPWAYNFKVCPPVTDVLIAINEEEAGKPILTATFFGTRKPFSDASLLAMLLRHPLMTVKIIAAILHAAVRLMWKGVQRHTFGTAA